jgi:adenosylcobinamide kinase/adenosylcobinamide-phosphate guanylyltransferase
MGKITFILGGARSGKSSYAIRLAKKFEGKIAFVATCPPLDEEMKMRIEIHKRDRPFHWHTFEEFKDLSTLLKKIGSEFDLIIIDCLTLFTSNLLLEGLADKEIEDRIDKLLRILKSIKCDSIIVSNEVGLGIVPEDRLARRFRDLAGKINQSVAKQSDEVFFMFSGFPLRIKE